MAVTPSAGPGIEVVGVGVVRTPEYRHRVVRYYRARAAHYDAEDITNWSQESAFRAELTQLYLEAYPSREWRLARPGQTPVFLDVGVGTGRTVTTLQRNLATRVIGVDISMEMLQVMRRKLSADLRVDAVVGDAHRLPLRSASVDICAMISCLQYLDLHRIAAEVSRVLRPRSEVVVALAVLHQDDRQRWRDLAFQQLDPPYLSRFHYAAEVVEAFQHTGFRLVRSLSHPVRRTFSSMRSDRGRTVDGEPSTVEAGIEILRSAPADVRRLYGIDDEGFTQHYALMRLLRIGEADASAGQST